MMWEERKEQEILSCAIDKIENNLPPNYHRLPSVDQHLPDAQRRTRPSRYSVQSHYAYVYVANTFHTLLVTCIAVGGAVPGAVAVWLGIAQVKLRHL